MYVDERQAQPVVYRRDGDITDRVDAHHVTAGARVTRLSPLSTANNIRARLHDAAGCSTADVKPHKRLNNRSDNRLDVCIHDTAGRPVVRPVVQPVSQPVVSCKLGITLTDAFSVSRA